MLIALLLAACAAPNPVRSTTPSPWQPPKKEQAPAPVGPVADPNAPAQAAATSPTQTPAASPAKSDPTSAPQTATVKSDAPNEPVIATVAGKPVYVSELLSQWMYSDSLRVLEELDKLAIGRLVVAEAQRLGVRLDPELATNAYERGIKALETEIHRDEKRASMTLDRYVDRVLGLDPIRYRERVRDDALRSLLGERVVRGWILQNEHAFVRVIITDGEDEMKAAQADLAGGMSFEDVAKKRSADPSGKSGGRVAPILKSETPMSRAAFATEVGKVGGPISDRGKFLLLEVTDRTPPLQGDWSAVGPVVEKSIADQPVDALELQQWKNAMIQRYDVDLKPFLRLVGEPTR